MKERKFKVKVKMKDDRKVEKMQKAIPGVRSMSSPISRAVAKKRRAKTDAASKAAWKKANPNKTHYTDYKPPIHGKRKK